MATNMSFTVVTTRINAPAWVLTGLAGSALLARLISRRFFVKPNALGLDDGVLIVAMMICLLGTSFITATIAAAEVVAPPTNIPGMTPRALALRTAANSVYAISHPVARIAVAIFLVRVFRAPRWTRLFLYGMCGIALLLGIAEFLLNWLQCSPPATLWNPYKHPTGVCRYPLDVLKVGYTLGAVYTLQDFVLALYPAFHIRKLQMPVRRKLLLTFLLGLGLFAGACSIIKTCKIASVVQKAKRNENTFNDSLWTAFWACVENCAIIIAVCVPTVFPLLRWAHERGLDYWSRMSGSRGSSIAARSSGNTSEDLRQGSQRFRPEDSSRQDSESKDAIVMQRFAASSSEDV